MWLSLRLLLPILFLLLSSSSTLAQTNTFSCDWFVDDCYVHSYSDCYAGYYPDSALCDQYDGPDQDACLNNINVTCITDTSYLYMCAGGGNCVPCESGDPLCVYTDATVCETACSSAGEQYRCDPDNGCVPDSTCTVGVDGCFANAIACESSDCNPEDQEPPPTCGDYDTQEECNPVENCTWRNGSCVVGAEPNATPTPYVGQDADINVAEFALCARAGDQMSDCETCYGQDGVWTAVGCLSFMPAGFSQDFLILGIALAGGIALLLMMYGSFLLSTSQGNPEQAQHAKEVIMGAVIGLFMIVFSMVLLRTIGIEVFRLPGF